MGEKKQEPIATPHEVWVIDTSSLLEVRRGLPQREHRRVREAMTKLVASGSLVFPSEVYGELERGHTKLKSGTPDAPFEWAKAVRPIANRLGTDFDAVKAALEKAPTVLDKDKVGGADEADPYVLGLALSLKRKGHEVTVVTEEIKDRPDKMSLSTACGLLRLYCLPLLPFLGDRAIWLPSS